MEERSYLGTGWAFPPAFVKQQGVQLVSEEEDIEQSLTILFSTTPGERLFRYGYGCNLREWVFEEINLSVKTLMADTIEQAICRWEPRILPERIDIDTDGMEEGVLRICVTYFIPAINSRRNKVYPFYFKEGTHI